MRMKNYVMESTDAEQWYTPARYELGSLDK